MAYTIRILSSIRDLDRVGALALFGDAVEGVDYLAACETSEAGTGFRVSMIAVYKGDLIVAAAPAFQVEYRLDLALPERFRRLDGLVRRIAAPLTSFPVWCLGTRTNEECPLRFSPTLSAHEREEAFAMLLRGLSDGASRARVRWLGVKYLTDEDMGWGHGPLEAAGFARMSMPPSAVLHLPFADEAGYLASLSANMRRDLKRKLRGFEKVAVEIRNSFDGIEDECLELLEATRARAKVDYGQFGIVPPPYLREIAAALGDRAVVILIRIDGSLASFSLSLVDGDRLMGKYIGMRYPLAQEHDVYFLNWMSCVRYCLEHNIHWLHVGVSHYRQKIRLGCKLKRCWLYFRHTGIVLNPLFGWLLPRMPLDLIDQDLAALDKEAIYLPPGVATGSTPRSLEQ